MLALSCKTGKINQESNKESLSTALIAIGSCNNQVLENPFWDDIAQQKPDIFIWGGDNIYADTDDIAKLKAMYQEQNNIPGYASLKKEVPVVGTWDDHDYGLNDGGNEFWAKKGSQVAFLDFMGVDKDSPRRNQEGVYWSHEIVKNGKMVKIIVLDTRYFRDLMTKSEDKSKRYDPNPYGQGTILGQEQWQWFESELKNSKADFNLIVTSIQFLSNEHGFEKWGNFPHEVDKMNQILKESNAKGVIFLSGDRHISEFSKMNIDGLSYPLIDFTSSGLTHSYANFSGEPNPFRIGDVVFAKSYGLLEINFVKQEVQFKMMGEGGAILQELKQTY